MATLNLGLGGAGIGAAQGIEDFLERKLRESVLRAQVARGEALSAQGDRRLDQSDQQIGLDRDIFAEGSRQFDAQEKRRGQEFGTETALRKQAQKTNEASVFGGLKLRGGELDRAIAADKQGASQFDQDLELRRRDQVLEEALNPSRIDLNTAGAEAARARAAASQAALAPGGGEAPPDPFRQTGTTLLNMLNIEPRGEEKEGGFLGFGGEIPEGSPQQELELRSRAGDPTAKKEMLRRFFLDRGNEVPGEDALNQFVADGSFELVFPHLAPR